jgi:hypothetical protein
VFAGILGELVQAKALRLGQRDLGAGESVYRGIEDDLSEYIKEDVLKSSNDPNLTGDSNLFRKPDDFYKLISLRVEGDERTPIELIYRPDQMSHVLSSNLSAPTELFPVALVSKSIEVFPTDVGSVIMTYYRQPASRVPVNSGPYVKGDCDYDSSPRFQVSFTDGQGFYTPDIVNSRDFDLPERFKGSVIAEICKMIGVRLRDTVLAQYGQTQTN